VTEWAQLRAEHAVLEDEAVLVLDKPAGISVTGERHETDLVRLARDAGEQLFPVHRIDKVTSGAVLLAKELRWHGPLTRQFAKQTVAKAYLAITSPGGLPADGTIDLPLSVGRKNRVRVAAQRAAIVADGAAGRWSVPDGEVFGQVRVYPSVTEFHTLWQDQRRALLLVWPSTGRRHQIRVHLAWVGHAIVCDPLFAAAGAGAAGGAPGAGAAGGSAAGTGAAAGRAYLHSWRLEFDAAWRDGARVRVEAPPGDGFWAPLGEHGPGRPAGLLAAARARCEERG
jgi:tRNA pseudouridine32 synthase / 23S rRNA pseudouridine746 synthase